MPDDGDVLIRRLIGEDATVSVELIDRATTSTTPSVLVAAALLASQSGDLLARAVASALARSARLGDDLTTAAALSQEADRRMPSAAHFITERDRTDAGA